MYNPILKNNIEKKMNKDRCFLPAEWQKQHAVQLTWPHRYTDWAPYLDDIVKMEVEIARNVADHEELIISTPEPEAVRILLENELTEKQMDRVHIYNVPTNDTWARDHAAITLLEKPAESLSGEGKATLLDFHFNGWGEKFAAEKDNMITSSLWEQGTFSSFYSKSELGNQLDFVLEGGAIESDGKGTLFTTSMCLLAPHRNQPMDRDEIEAELKRRLCVERVVWIDYGNLIGDDTDGHIDTIVRVAPDDTLLYVKCSDKDDDQYAEFEAMEKQLKTFRTMEGKPYRLLPLPMPRAIYDDGDRLPATYANFLVINDAVLVPTYDQPDLDSLAIKTISEAFPDRDVVGIDARVAVRQHGSLHCLTMQFPA